MSDIQVTKMHQQLCLVALVCMSFVTLVLGVPRPMPLGLSKVRATHVPPEADLRRNLHKWVWPNSFYDIPKYRFPYYDEHGNGKLLYGFGGKDLYKYSVFKPIDGYLK